MPLMPKGKMMKNVEKITKIYEQYWNIIMNKSNWNSYTELRSWSYKLDKISRKILYMIICFKNIIFKINLLKNWNGKIKIWRNKNF